MDRWRTLPGGALDIAVASGGIAWVIGTNETPGGFGIYRWDGAGWTGVPGGAVRIATEPNGTAWVVNSSQQIFRFTGGGWTHLPGLAYDVGVDASGTAWVIGTNPVPGGFGIYRWNGSDWNGVPGGAVRIDVSDSGTPWVVNSGDTIFRRDGDDWTVLPGAAKDVGVGPGAQDGWVIGTNALDGGFGIYRWDGGNWNVIDGAGVGISVGGDGLPWMVDAKTTIRDRIGSSSTFRADDVELEHVPLAPVKEVDANTIYRSARDARLGAWLPGYGVRQTKAVPPKDPQVLVAFDAVSGGTTAWRLTAQLGVEGPPAARDVARLVPLDAPAPARAFLSYKTPWDGTKTVDFDECAPETIGERPGLKLSVTVSDVGLRNEIRQAMIDPTYVCAICLVRAPRVALPTGQGAGPDTRYTIDTPSIQSSTKFWFPADASGYIFGFAGGGVAGDGPRARAIVYRGVTHTYFQDPAQSTRFYYLPDAFKLARSETPPFYPCLSVSITGDTAETAQATVSFVATPVVDDGRYADALRTLTEELSGAGVTLDPFPASAPVFKLRVPDGDPAGPYEARTHAQVSISDGIRDALTKPLAEFRDLLDSLFDGVSSVLTGAVTVKVGSFEHDIPFTARMDDLVGPVFERTSTLDDATTVRITLRNRTEGVIQVHTAPVVSVVHASASAPAVCRVTSTTPAVPTRIQPAPEGVAAPENTTLTLRVRSPIALTAGAFDVRVETPDAKVESTSEALLNAVISPTIKTRFSRSITVTIPTGVFTKDPTLAAIDVAFDNGDTVMFSASLRDSGKPTASDTARVHRSIVGYLTGSADDKYRYRVIKLHHDGSRHADAEWRTDDVSGLLVDLT
jgi:Tectonin domain